jgi:hypothetical protein
MCLRQLAPGFVLAAVVVAAACGSEPAAASDPLSAMQLDAGRKWKADDHTRQHIATMAAAVKSSDSDRHIGLRLRELLSALMTGCTMQGAPHDALHVYLSALASEIDAMQQTNQSAAHRAHERATAILGRFGDYFE